MIPYIVRRILIAIPALWGVLTLVFLSVHLLPGDPAELMLYGRGTAQDVERLRHQLGLDQPLPAQYGSFMLHAIHLDFGRSITSNRPVFAEIMERFPTTLKLAFGAMTLGVIFGLIGGVIAALNRRSPVGPTTTGIAVIGISIPDFFMGTMLALLFGVTLGWLPVAGPGGIRYFVLPAATLAIHVAAVLTRIVRSTLVDVMSSDYIRTARSKGLSGHTILYVHAFKNALIPVITIMGLTFAELLGGVVIIENVFSLPGLGSLAVSAVDARDFPVIEGTTFFFALILIIVNLLVDVSYAVLDPRIRYS